MLCNEYNNYNNYFAIISRRLVQFVKQQVTQQFKVLRFTPFSRLTCGLADLERTPQYGLQFLFMIPTTCERKCTHCTSCSRIFLSRVSCVSITRIKTSSKIIRAKQHLNLKFLFSTLLMTLPLPHQSQKAGCLTNEVMKNNRFG